MLCDHHPYRIPEHSITPKIKSQAPPSPWALPTTALFLCFWICLFLTFLIKGIIRQYGPFVSGFLPWAWCFHGTDGDFIPSEGWTTPHCADTPHCVHCSFVLSRWALGLFPNSGCYDNAATNLCVQVFVWMCFQFSLNSHKVSKARSNKETKTK